MIQTGDPQSFRDKNLLPLPLCEPHILLGTFQDQDWASSCTKTWPKDKSKQPKVIRIKHYKGTALCRWAKQQLCFNAHLFGFFVFVFNSHSSYCRHTTFTDTRRHDWDIYHMVGRVSIFRVDRSPCAALSAIRSRAVSTSPSSLNIWPQRFRSTPDQGCTKNVPRFFQHKIMGHVILFSHFHHGISGQWNNL